MGFVAAAHFERSGMVLMGVQTGIHDMSDISSDHVCDRCIPVEGPHGNCWSCSEGQHHYAGAPGTASLRAASVLHQSGRQKGEVVMIGTLSVPNTQHAPATPSRSHCSERRLKLPVGHHEPSEVAECLSCKLAEATGFT